MSRTPRGKVLDAPARRTGPRRFTRILVPIDLSDRNARTLATALALARQNRARVTLLHVIQQVADTPVAELDDFYRQLSATAERRLERAAAPFARSGLVVKTETCVGDPAREVIRVSLRDRVNLLVMGSHRVRPGGKASGWGTTSYKVGVFCQCPVLLVK